MKDYLQSTKEEPLKFFTSFLNKISISRFEKNFYSPKHPINPSFTSNKKEGYISYHKDFVVNSEPPLIKIYYDTELSRLLDRQTDISIGFIKQRNIEMLYNNPAYNISNDKYLQNQKIELKNLKVGVVENSINIKSLKPILNKIEDCIEKLLKGVTPKIQKISQRIPGNTFFGLKSNYRRKDLIRLYEKSVELEIFDNDIVSDQDFIDVFSTTYPIVAKPIQFSEKSLIVIHYFHSISPAFHNLKAVRIEQSELFISKGGTLISANNFYAIASNLKSKEGVKYNIITEAINSVLL